MKKRRFLMLLCLFFGAILMGCNEKETEVIEQPEIKEEVIVVSKDKKLYDLSDILEQ